MPKSTKNRRNTRWTGEEVARLIKLLADDTPCRAIATELKRSYVAVETKAGQLKRLASKNPKLNDDLNRVASLRPNIRDTQPPPMNLMWCTTSEAARAVVSVLYEGAMTYRAATIAKSNNQYSKLRPRLQSVIGAILRGLIGEHNKDGGAGWLRVSTSRIRASQVGINADVFRNLLDALEKDGFIERLNGNADAMDLSNSKYAQRGRVTRVRGTVELFDLCAHHQITADNVTSHFSPALENLSPP
jgi:hypothetical protein